MRGMPFTLQENKGVFGLSEISAISTTSVGKWKKENSFGNLASEPTSVLDSRSPSTPTSTSTLSSSFGGGGCGFTDTASVAAVSDYKHPLHQKWPPTTTQEDSSGTAATTPAEAEPLRTGGGGGNRKDEWASELQPIPAGLEIVNGGGGSVTGGGAGKYVLSMEDWDNMLTEQAASPSILRWMIDDVQDPSSGLLQGVGPSEFQGNAGFGIVDPGFGFESTMAGGEGGSTGPGSAMNMNLGGGSSLGAAGGVPGSGLFPPNNNGGRFSLNSVQNPSSFSLFNFNIIPPHIFNQTTSSPSSNQVFSPPNNNSLPNLHNLPLPLSLPPGVFFPNQQFEVGDEKPQLFNPQLLNNQNHNNQPKNTSFYVPLTFPHQQQQDQSLFPQLKRHQIDPKCQIQKPTFMDSGQELLLKRQHQQQQQDQQQQQQQYGFPYPLKLLPNHLQQM